MAELKGIVRIVDADVVGEMPIQHALTKVKGVSFMLANAACSALKLDRKKQVGYLTPEEINKITDCLKNPKKYNIPSWLFNRRRDAETGEDTHIISADLILRLLLLSFQNPQKSPILYRPCWLQP